MSELKPHPEGISVNTPFNRNFVYDLKESIPSHERKWDGVAKLWIVHPKHGQTVQKLILRYFRENVSIPQVNAITEKRRGTIKLLYVGSAKEREDGSRTAFGMHFDTKQWSVVFPESVLRNWFDGIELDSDISEHTVLPKGSYYLTLGLKSVTDNMDEIKSAYRRMARQWHPDVCKEPDATERFKLINEAYAALSDPRQKKLYDIGMRMVDSTTSTKKASRSAWYQDDYKPDLRCGVIDCDYEVLMGRAFVQKIHSWADITNARGETLVTSWRMNDKEPTVYWV
jgi:hypothetical protein